jgi:hypothetical protein
MVPVLITLTAIAWAGCYYLAKWAERVEIKHIRREPQTLRSYAPRRKNAAAAPVREIPGTVSRTFAWIKTLAQFGLFTLTLLLCIEGAYALVKYRGSLAPLGWPVMRLIWGIVIFIAVTRYAWAFWKDWRHPPGP